MTPTEINVEHDQAAKRFIVRLDGHMATTAYERHGGTITFVHTVVPPMIEGRGVGSALARAALDYAKAERVQVVPQCHFVAAYIERHPEYRELVAG